MGLFSRKILPKKFLGIDIGTSFIKIVELGKKGEQLNLENYGELGLPHPKNRAFVTFEKNGLNLSNQDIARAIQLICQEAKIQTKEVNFSIPDFSSFFTVLKLPQMTKDEIPEAIRYEVRPYIPLPHSEIALDWTVIEGEIGKTNLRILAVAIPNDTISQFQEIAKFLNLKVTALEPEAFALMRSLRFLAENKISALIDIGAKTTNCSILDKGVLKTSHSFNLGSNEFTEVLARFLNIDYNKAEELKKQKGITGADQEGKEVRKTLLPLFDGVITEIKKIFRNFYQSEGKEIEKVILSGGVVFLPGFGEYFCNELRKELVIANPFLSLSSPPVLKEKLQLIGPAYSVGVGLAMRGFE